MSKELETMEMEETTDLAETDTGMTEESNSGPGLKLILTAVGVVTTAGVVIAKKRKEKKEGKPKMKWKLTRVPVEEKAKEEESDIVDSEATEVDETDEK